ncbi:hypothetical protein ACTWP5_11920 [Streptomyces sp. 4N509B]
MADGIRREGDAAVGQVGLPVVADLQPEGFDETAGEVVRHLVQIR